MSEQDKAATGVSVLSGSGLLCSMFWVISISESRVSEVETFAERRAVSWGSHPDLLSETEASMLFTDIFSSKF